ncbi:hypothetical protein JW992_02105 [candidate division KSB1 bacterium]|nr:hypothetical protein [candidate division KSB1 bacterium]
MVFLVLSIFSSVAIAHIFKWAQRKKLSTLGLLTVNYFLAAFLAILDSTGTDAAMLPPPSFFFAVVVGGLFVGSFFLMTKSIEKMGVTLPVALMRLSAVLPTLGSIFFFFEMPHAVQIVGMLTAFVALPLANQPDLTGSEHRRLGNHFIQGLALFGLFGLTDFSLKIQTELFALDNPNRFLAVVFTTALIITAVGSWIERIRISRDLLIGGMILGLFNLLSSFFFLKALPRLPGLVVYPTNGIGIILLAALSSKMIWRENLHPRTIRFLILASFSLVLINWK